MNTLKIERRNGYAVVELNQGKVNAINTELAKDLLDFFTHATTDETIKGVILTGRPHCFSAGLDIFKIATGGIKDLEIFWRNFLAALQTMVRFPKPFICAITGFAPAGGTVLTCCADYRIMGRGKKHKIGMHEIAISLQIPELLCRIYAHWIGDKTALEYVMNGRLMQADEAVKIGLVNEACEVEEVLPKPPMKTVGHVTSSYMSPNVGRSIALALVKDGFNLKGQSFDVPNIDGGSHRVKITDPIFLNN